MYNQRLLRDIKTAYIFWYFLYMCTWAAVSKTLSVTAHSRPCIVLLIEWRGGQNQSLTVNRVSSHVTIGKEVLTQVAPVSEILSIYLLWLNLSRLLGWQSHCFTWGGCQKTGKCGHFHQISWWVCPTFQWLNLVGLRIKHAILTTSWSPVIIGGFAKT